MWCKQQRICEPVFDRYQRDNCMFQQEDAVHTAATTKQRTSLTRTKLSRGETQHKLIRVANAFIPTMAATNASTATKQRGSRPTTSNH